MGASVRRAFLGLLAAIFLMLALGTYFVTRASGGAARFVVGIVFYAAAVAGLLIMYLAARVIKQARTNQVLMPAGEPDALRSLIIVARPVENGTDFLRSHVVEIDRKPVGRLRLGGWLSIEAAPGTHTLRATIGGWGSSDLVLDLHGGEVAIIKVERGSGSTISRLFQRENWLRLVIAEPG